MCGLICSMFVGSVWKHIINALMPSVKVTCFCATNDFKGLSFSQ